MIVDYFPCENIPVGLAGFATGNLGSPSWHVYLSIPSSQCQALVNLLKLQNTGVWNNEVMLIRRKIKIINASISSGGLY